MGNLPGYGSPQYVAMAGQPGSGPQAPAVDGGRNTAVIDGTPVRIVILAFAAAAGLTALKWSGFRFNVGVST